MQSHPHTLTTEQIHDIAQRTEGYSGSDVDGLVREAALGPIRSIKDIRHIDVGQVRPIELNDFEKALGQIRKSVGDGELEGYKKFDQEFGSRPGG